MAEHVLLIPSSFSVFHRAVNGPFKRIPELNTCTSGIDTGVHQYGLVLAIGGCPQLFSDNGCTMNGSRPPRVRVRAGCCPRESEMFSDLSLVPLLANCVNMSELLRLSSLKLPYLLNSDNIHAIGKYECGLYLEVFLQQRLPKSPNLL